VRNYSASKLGQHDLWHTAGWIKLALASATPDNPHISNPFVVTHSSLHPPIIMFSCCCLSTALIGAALISILSFLVPYILDGYVFKEQDLKRRYNAKWALVTGASSGIGRALTHKLAKQGINVVMVAVDDALLTSVHEKMTKEFPALSFRKVGVNLGVSGYMASITAATSDILPTLIFNNAGYIATGLFSDSPLNSLMANYECNATAPIQITHHFVTRMVEEGKRDGTSKMRGAVFFTSSPAGLMPCPTTVMYGATKAFITEFATSVAADIYPDGIDVLVVNPSPVDTGFYSGNKHDMNSMKFFQRTATSPEHVASCFLKSIGRTLVCEQGYFAFTLKMILKLIDVNLIAAIIQRTSTMNGDYAKLIKQRNTNKKE